MSGDEYGEIAYLLKNAWPGQFADDNEAAYGEFLLPYDFDAVKAALHKLAREGLRFVPSVSVIIGAVRDLIEPVVPSWTEVWQQVENAMTGRSPLEDIDQRVADFVRREGLRKLQLTEFYDPDNGDMRIYQLRMRWEEFVDVQQAREQRQHALRAGGMEELPSHRLELERGR